MYSGKECQSEHEFFDGVGSELKAAARGVARGEMEESVLVEIAPE